jgi:DNA-binding NarL/FixJ family response regulator
MVTDKMQVFIISQQSLFRRGIEHSLSAAGDMEVTSATEVNDKMLSNLETMPPDVAIVDIDGTPDGGLALLRKIKQRLPNIGVVILSANTSETQLFQALKAQASAFVSKDVTAEQLIEILRRVARGEHPINETLTTNPRVAEQVLQQFQELSRRSEAEAFISPLTPRETEILNHIAQGLPNKQIALQLSISEQTIKNHVTSILRKLNANARTEAVVVAIKQGLISLS